MKRNIGKVMMADSSKNEILIKFPPYVSLSGLVVLSDIEVIFDNAKSYVEYPSKPTPPPNRLIRESDGG